MGRLRLARRRTAVPQSDRPSPDSVAAVLDGQRSFQETDCERSGGCVIYQGRESLTFNGVPGNLLRRVSYGDGRSNRFSPSTIGITTSRSTTPTFPLSMIL